MLVGVIGYYDSEPWPAFVFPGFKNVYVYNGLYKISKTEFEFYDDSNKLISTLEADELLTGLPQSQLSGVISELFQTREKVNNLSYETRKWLIQSGRKILGNQVYRLDIIRKDEYFERSDSELRVDSVDNIYRVSIYN